MQQINEILQLKRQSLKKSERSQIISELYDIYLKDKTGRKKENWARYVKWCKQNKKPKGSENEFRKTKLFIKEVPIKSFCYLLSHIPTKDLYYIKSVAYDKLNRNENAGGYIIGSLKIK